MYSAKVGASTHLSGGKYIPLLTLTSTAAAFALFDFFVDLGGFKLG